MVTLSKRATPSQHRILRAVEGAVKNVAHYHPEWGLHPHIARSIAKRAAGTLTAQWPDVLAARSASSVNGVVSLPDHARHRQSQVLMSAVRGAVPPVHRRSPLIDIWREIARTLSAVKKTGNTERANALIDVLKMIAARQSKPETQNSSG